jgi:Mce-associated membrane protein
LTSHEPAGDGDSDAAAQKTGVFTFGNKRAGSALPDEVAESAGTSSAAGTESGPVEKGVTDHGGVGDGGDAASQDDRAPGLRGVGGMFWLFLAASIAAVVMAYVSWHHADTNPDRHRAALRDEALIEGTAGVETMTSMDHRDVAAGIKAWQSVSTGVLHDQLTAIGADQEKMLADQGKIATGRVVEAALTDLTDRTATMIVAVEVTVRDDDQSKDPAVKRNRFSADLALVGGQWKIENLQQVAVNVS